MEVEFRKIQNISTSYDAYQASSLQTMREAIEDYGDDIKLQYRDMTVKQARDSLLSEYNYQIRSKLKSCRRFGLYIYPGDLCYVDFGRAYLSEAGYQHFALVMSVFCGKAFVIPMTSKKESYQQAYDEKTNPAGFIHLMRLGLPDGLNRYSVLFLNDAKYINTARIIDVKGHIDVNGEQFREIRKRVLQGICGEQ